MRRHAMTNVEGVELLITQALGAARASVLATCEAGSRKSSRSSSPSRRSVASESSRLDDWMVRGAATLRLSRGGRLHHRLRRAASRSLRRLLARTATRAVCGEVTTVCCDETVLRLMLAEAVSNARKYRDPKRPIVLRATVRVDKEPAAENGNENASTPIAETVYGGWIEVEMESVNCEGAAALTTEQLQRVFEPGYRAQAAAASSGDGA